MQTEEDDDTGCLHKNCGGKVLAYHTDSMTNGFYDVYMLACELCGHVVDELDCIRRELVLS